MLSTLRKIVLMSRFPAGAPVEKAATHAYPSSSRKRHDWDSIVKQSAEEDEELKKDFAKDPNAGGDQALNELFQKLYADATDDQRRAMIKSYQESNGTALSTDWSDVGKVRSFPSHCSAPARRLTRSSLFRRSQKKVETRPPDSMLAKKWEQ